MVSVKRDFSRFYKTILRFFITQVIYFCFFGIFSSAASAIRILLTRYSVAIMEIEHWKISCLVKSRISGQQNAYFLKLLRKYAKERKTDGNSLYHIEEDQR